MTAWSDFRARLSKPKWSQRAALRSAAREAIRIVPFQLDRAGERRTAIGVIVLATDCTIENELRRLLSSNGVSLYHSRIENSSQITPESLTDMEARITECVAALVPGSHLDVVAYGCTAATVIMGETAIFDKIRVARPGVSCTSPVTAALAAFQWLGIARVALLTPYRADLTRQVRSYICARGVDVPVAATFDEQDDNAVARISEPSIFSAALELGRSDNVDAVFISCT